MSSRPQSVRSCPDLNLHSHAQPVIKSQPAIAIAIIHVLCYSRSTTCACVCTCTLQAYLHLYSTYNYHNMYGLALSLCCKFMCYLTDCTSCIDKHDCSVTYSECVIMVICCMLAVHVHEPLQSWAGREGRVPPDQRAFNPVQPYSSQGKAGHLRM